MKHTKPPWEVDKDYEGSYVAIRDKNKEVVCGAFPNNERTLSNLTLISAAPELLAACRTALKHLPQEELFIENDSEYRAVIKIRKAIEKAVGKSL